MGIVSDRKEAKDWFNDLPMKEQKKLAAQYRKSPHELSDKEIEDLYLSNYFIGVKK